jgi:integrase
MGQPSRQGVALFSVRITETGLRVYKELAPMRKDQAFRRQMALARERAFLFPSDRNGSGHQTTFKTVWIKTLRRAKIPYFRNYDLRSTYATRLTRELRRHRSEFFQAPMEMGDSNAAPGRRASHEEVLSDETADEARGPGEA